MKVGVLALQGGFELHVERLKKLGAAPLLIKKESELDAVDALIIPGGESSAMLKLCGESFRDKIAARLKTGMPALTTCAGTILLADKVENPAQDSLKIIDIDVKRNAYGRQVDSFIAADLAWTAEGRQLQNAQEDKPVEAVFIRAPRITRVGPGVLVLLKHQNDPILVRQGQCLAATFHPELSQHATSVHGLFLSLLANVH